MTIIILNIFITNPPAANLLATEVPASEQPCGPRINLTFRWIKVKAHLSQVFSPGWCRLQAWEKQICTPLGLTWFDPRVPFEVRIWSETDGTQTLHLRVQGLGV